MVMTVIVASTSTISATPFQYIAVAATLQFLITLVAYAYVGEQKNKHTSTLLLHETGIKIPGFQRRDSGSDCKDT